MELCIRKKKSLFHTVGVMFGLCGLSLIELVIVFAPVLTVKFVLCKSVVQLWYHLWFLSAVLEEEWLLKSLVFQLLLSPAVFLSS